MLNISWGMNPLVQVRNDQSHAGDNGYPYLTVNDFGGASAAIYDMWLVYRLPSGKTIISDKIDTSSPDDQFVDQIIVPVDDYVLAEAGVLKIQVVLVQKVPGDTRTLIEIIDEYNNETASDLIVKSPVYEFYINKSIDVMDSLANPSTGGVSAEVKAYLQTLMNNSDFIGYSADVVASRYNGDLRAVDDPAVFNIDYSPSSAYSGWTFDDTTPSTNPGTPTQNAYVIINSRYSVNYNLQLALGHGSVKKMYYRVIDRRDHSVYVQWVDVTGSGGGGGGSVTVDEVISGTSTNPVQNKVIKAALDEKQDIFTTELYSESVTPALLTGSNPIGGVNGETIPNYQDNSVSAISEELIAAAHEAYANNKKLILDISGTRLVATVYMQNYGGSSNLMALCCNVTPRNTPFDGTFNLIDGDRAGYIFSFWDNVALLAAAFTSTSSASETLKVLNFATPLFADDVDAAISSSSENPVQNKVIKAAMDEKQDVVTLELYSDSISPAEDTGVISGVSGEPVTNYVDASISAVSANLISIARQAADNNEPLILDISGDRVEASVLIANDGSNTIIILYSNVVPSADPFDGNFKLVDSSLPGYILGFVDPNGTCGYTSTANTSGSIKVLKVGTPLFSENVDVAISSTSMNPVQNKTIFTALDGKVSASRITAIPPSNSTNTAIPTSGAVYTAIQNAIGNAIGGSY